MLSDQSSLPSTMFTDENRLKQIIINLLSNAIKYTEEGQVTLSGLVDRTRRRLKIVV